MDNRRDKLTGALCVRDSSHPAHYWGNRDFCGGYIADRTESTDLRDAVAEALRRHSDANLNVGCWVCEGCGIELGARRDGDPYEAMYAHQADAVLPLLAARIDTARAEGAAEALRAAAWDIERGAGLLPPPRGEHPAVTWLHARAGAAAHDEGGEA